jgi:hypothetical protein
MADEESHVTFGSADFETIEAAVMETARGRWFLREYARRNRNADTEAVLAALRDLERSITRDRAAASVDGIRAGLENMASAIARTKSEIGLAPQSGCEVPRDSLEALSRSIEAESEEAFQAIAEQRIRRIFQTLRYLEGRIHDMIAICDPARASPDARTLPEQPGPGEERTIHPGTHPSFLM